MNTLIVIYMWILKSYTHTLTANW